MASKDRDPLSPLGAGVFAALRRERLSAGLAAHLTDQGYQAVHDPATGRVRATDPLGHSTCYDPDHQGFVGAVTSPLGRRWQLDNDPKGRLTGLTDPAGTRLTIGYDERGRPATLARQGGPAFRLAYDGADNLTEALWPDGTRETFDYRDYRLLSACTDRAGARQGYDYDAAGRLCAATDANGAVTRFLYGAWDRPDATLYPDGRREDYTWQPSPADPGRAQLAALGDAAGPYARLRYADGRIAAIAYRDGEQVSFRHDAAGHVLEAGVGDRLVRFTYDAAGRVLTEETGGAKILYRYDPAGNLVGVEGPTGAIGYAWNPDLELAAIRAWDGSTAELTYSPDGRVCETRLSDRLTSRTVRTGGGRLGEVEVSAAGQRLYAARYAYDGEDRLAGVAQTEAPTLQYAYDPAGRLAAVTRADGTAASDDYDPAGYRLRSDRGQASYDAAGKVLASGPERLVYDDRGRVIERTEGGARWEYQWSDRGLLTAARSSAGPSVDYGYDAFARRTSKRVTDAQGQVTQTRFLWAGEQLIAELCQGPAGVSRRDYLWYPGGHSLFALRIDGAIYYAHNDHLGVTRRLTDPWGGTAWAAELDPWGEARVRDGHIDQPWRLPGQYQDAETGLHYNRFRYYVPSLGRYLSPDPLGLSAGFDPYAYAGNDPINGADPLGLWTWAGVAKVAVSVVAAVAVGAAVLALAPVAAPIALIAVGAAVAAVGFGLNAALNQAHFCLPCIVNATQDAITEAIERHLSPQGATGSWLDVSDPAVMLSPRTSAVPSTGTGTLTVAVRYVPIDTPVKDASVTIEGPVAQTIKTDADGVSRFVGLPAGQYRITSKYDGDNALVRIARSKVDSTDWGYANARSGFPENTNKCNLFVYEIAVAAGFSVPQKFHDRKLLGITVQTVSIPPNAGDWADSASTVVTYPSVSSPQPGDIVAWSHPEFTDATGHVGIVSYPKDSSPETRTLAPGGSASVTLAMRRQSVSAGHTTIVEDDHIFWHYFDEANAAEIARIVFRRMSL